MDIENMHPFCLPFSLCHDATSSSIIDEDYAKLSDGDKPGSNQVKSGMDDTSLLMDDPIDRLTCSNTPQCSIINEDHFIGSSSSGSSHDVFDLLDMEMRTDSDFELGDINSDDICNKSDDWFSLTGSHDCSLFSPVDENAHHRTHNKLHLKSPSGYSSSHQVFQHIVDPVDIKSSPTLAQLNLNSTEDPSDGLWDSTSAATTTSTTSTLISSTAHHHHHHHHHLNSSSPSDLSSSVSSCNNLIGTPASATSCAGGHFVSTCSHLGNHLQSNRFDESSAQHTSHLSNLHLHSCQHHPYHSHYHQHVNHDVRHSSSNSQSTCLAVAPFRKGTIHTQQGNSLAIVHPGCCSNHSQDHHLDRYNASSPGMQVQPQLLCAPKLRTNLNQNQSTHLSSACHQSIGVMDKNGVHRVHQQRCHSPVPLVTSSSSPLSSSTTHNLTGENRGENKLKENIEYLTVLLCNGSKKFDKRIVNQQAQPEQQSTISSSMVKSYSTLAQSLSTGPKLLERYQSTHQHVHAISSHPSISAQSQSNDQTNTVDDVMLQCVAQTEPKLSNTQGAEPMCSKHCLKPMNVESSISAADSTAGNQHPDSIEHPTGPCYARHSIPSTANPMDSSQTQVSRSSDMKVLSSLLLNSNKCIGQVNPDPMSGTPIVKDNYGQNQTHRVTWTTPCGQNVVQTNQQAPNSNGLYRSDSFSNGNNNIYNRNDSIPINGRPITLTPLVSNNVSIPQRQPATNQQTNSKSKTPTFIQPASPSTSSTTSSSGNTEISPSFSITKKPKSNTTGKDSNQSERSGRPSSLSTDCSLSSHDEGFSSQIDQDDCGNSVRDSDDESDIDSDDESFYGDYTNNDLIGASISDNPECKWTLNMGRTRRNGQRRFFWQYNVQSKGPKGTRICPSDGAEDPFVLPEASDPVFSNECQVEGVKHSGKARRGDGNDLTPNPRKLLMIGLELKKLSKIINELAPVTDLPINARNKTRKEKNKLASRACRLKKKAQHEANKIKLYGLQREHQQVVMAIFDARKMIHKALTVEQSQVASLTDGPLSATLQKMLERCLMTVAGQTGDYVNSVLEKVVSGCIDGGLQS